MFSEYEEMKKASDRVFYFILAGVVAATSCFGWFVYHV